MKIALINESSQADKNALIYKVLQDVVEPMGHVVFNYGMHDEDSEYHINYADAGLLTAILLNTNTVDFVVTGCGTGEGACMASNMYPNVYCGYVKDATDAYLFAQVNHGNAISMPFAKDFGWCAELNLQYVFEKLFGCKHGVGYPLSRGPVQKEFRTYFETMKQVASKNMVDILSQLDTSILRSVIHSQNFTRDFPIHAKKNDVYNFMTHLEEE